MKKKIGLICEGGGTRGRLEYMRGVSRSAFLMKISIFHIQLESVQGRKCWLHLYPNKENA